MKPASSINHQRHVLKMGEIAVSSDPGEIICYGLGSCVGVFLYDKFQKVGAGAHIALPPRKENSDSEVMLQNIVDGMLQSGSDILFMRARLVGGANVMNMNSYRVGERNAEYIRHKLKLWGIMVLSEDTGGHQSRTVRLDVSTGRLAVSSLNKNCYTI